MTVEEVTQVSPNSLKLKRLIKAPMLLMITASAIMSGISVCLMKATTEIIEAGEFKTSWSLITLIMTGAIISGLS